MALTPAAKHFRILSRRLRRFLALPSSGNAGGQDQPKGIALFMVVAGISVLSILVTEFTYIAQVNQKMAFDGLDQIKAHYLAKSGFKLSLLRLKAYVTVKGVAKSLGGASSGGSGDASGGGGMPGVPKAVLEKIWSFPFMYPIPTNIPGMTPGDKDRIEKFQKSTNLEGRFTSLIESESSKYNLNMILAPYAPKTTASPSPTPTTSPQPGASPTPAPSPKFDVEQARTSLQEYLSEILARKFEADPDFAAEYRDFRIEEFMDHLVGWADPSYQKRTPARGKDEIPPKKGPFYSLSELRMLPGMDDRLYELFEPALTVSTTPGINVNTMGEATLRALVPQMSEEESKEFFKFRDSEEEDNLFKEPDDFFKYLQKGVAAFQGNEELINQLKQNLQKRNIRVVVDETEFKISVTAEVNQTMKRLEARVTLTGKKTTTNNKTPGGAPSPTPTPSPTGATTQNTGTPMADPGLRVTFMRIL